MTATPPKKSCQTCPSYLRPEAVGARFGKATGSPHCGRFGTALGRADANASQLRKLAEFKGSRCPEHGEPMPAAKPANPNFEVALPDPDARQELPDGDQKKRSVSACSRCKNYIPEQVVASEMSWASGLCAAKGRLILVNRQVEEAQNCEFRHFGPNRMTTVGLHLYPEYEDAFNFGVDPVRAYFQRVFIDPRSYETDQVVTDEQQASGIRAWRRIEDPEGTGNEVFLPIYNLDIFDESERSKIPETGDDEHPELYVDHAGLVYRIAVLWTQLDETPALWGVAGVGKTELYRHMAWLMCLPFERISVTASTELDDLAGKMHFDKERGTYFEYGRLPNAWKKPCVICLDEPNVGPPDVWQFIRPLTDNSKQLVLDMNKGERIPRHDDCYLGMAMNPSWDPRNVGTQQIGDADARRLMHIFVDLPPAVLEKEIVRKRVAIDGWEIANDTLDALMRVAADLRRLSDEGTLPVTWGISQQIKVARAFRWFSPTMAYKLASGDYLESEAQEVLLDAVRAHMEV